MCPTLWPIGPKRGHPPNRFGDPGPDCECVDHARNPARARLSARRLFFLALCSIGPKPAHSSNR